MENNRKPRIAVIGLKGLPAYGGAGSIGELVINELKNNYDFVVYSNSANTNLKTGKYNGFQQIVFKSIKHQGFNFLLYFFKSAVHCLFYESYDIIHVHHLAGGFILPLLKIKYKKIIVTSHGMPDKRDKWSKISWLYYPPMRFLFSYFSTYLTTVSDLDKKFYNKFTKKEIIYIPNGIKVEKINRDNDINKFDVFFAAGRIMASKGCHILLESLKDINYEGSIAIAGDLNQIQSYKKKIISYSTQLNISFLGLIKNKNLLLKYIKNSGIFVFPSSVEAMSMMLLEAASTRTPIIASDIPENKAVFSSKEVLFFKTDNINDLTKKITYAFNNKQVMDNKAELAYEKLKKEYSIKAIGHEYSELYNKLNRK